MSDIIPPTKPVRCDKQYCFFNEGPYCQHDACNIKPFVSRPLLRYYKTVCVYGDQSPYCGHPMCVKNRFPEGVPKNAWINCV